MQQRWRTHLPLPLSLVMTWQLGAAEPDPKITVFVYNYAAISPADLAKTKAEAARIFGRGGIEIEWLDSPLSPREAALFPACDVPPGPTRLAIRILPRPMAERLGPRPDSFGFALHPSDGNFAMVANAFAHRAGEMARSHRLGRGVLLGHIVAHELGHLLLGANSHSGAGVMRDSWHARELERIAQGTMEFSAGEARRMQTSIRARIKRGQIKIKRGQRPISRPGETW
jgi:hypothetical protein